jgi:outer membrane lipoprotein carrier protein
VCLLIIAFSALQVYAGSEVDDTVNLLQNKLSKINDLNGIFSQTSFIQDLEETQKYSGTFFIKKPSLMMWEYDKPRDEKVVINGSDTWIYKKSQNQVIKTKFSSEAYSQVPIALILSMENIRNDFAIILTRENALQLTPKRKIGFIKTLVIEISSVGFPVKMFTIFDTYGNIIMIELHGVKTNPGIDDALFQFTVPKGAEVFDLDE